MTVAELIAALSALHRPDLGVFFDDSYYEKPTWAADCYPEIVGVTITPTGVHLVEILKPGTVTSKPV